MTLNRAKDFDFDMFLGGPPDRRSPFPYKAMIKDAFPDLRIYDWESYQGKDYQAHNHEMIKKSLMMVSLVPSFPLPGIGPEIGYFYCYHEALILENFEVPHIVMIWPETVQPDFAKKTLAQYGMIVPTVEDAIEITKTSNQVIDIFFGLQEKAERDRLRVDIVDQTGWELPAPEDQQLLNNHELLEQIVARNNRGGVNRTPPLHPGPEQWRRD